MTETLYLGDYFFCDIDASREKELDALLADLRGPDGCCDGHDLSFDRLLVATYVHSNPQEYVFLLYIRDGVLYEANIDQSSCQGWLMDEGEADIDVLLHRLENGTITRIPDWDGEIAAYLRGLDEADFPTLRSTKLLA